MKSRYTAIFAAAVMLTACAADNIISDAAKTLEGGGNISKVYFSVENNGEPIPKEDIPRLFDRYYRADKAHSSGGGFGPGLAIANMIVIKHHGSIGVTSSPEGITVFTAAL